MPSWMTVQQIKHGDVSSGQKMCHQTAPDVGETRLSVCGQEFTPDVVTVLVILL